MMARAPSLQAARALMRDTPVGSPQDAATLGSTAPELEVAPRQVGVLSPLPPAEAVAPFHRAMSIRSIRQQHVRSILKGKVLKIAVQAVISC